MELARDGKGGFSAGGTSDDPVLYISTSVMIYRKIKVVLKLLYEISEVI
jgi:hypothetical protein